MQKAPKATVPLRAHPITVWLRSELPRTMKAAADTRELPGADETKVTVREYQFVFDLLSHLIALPHYTRIRTDKQRRSLGGYISKVLAAIEDPVTMPGGMALFPLDMNPTRTVSQKRAAVTTFLKKWQSDLTRTRRTVIPLTATARMLRLHGIDDPDALMEIADCAGVACEPKSARRYYALAKRVWSERTRGAQLDWHLLNVLEHDHHITR